MFGDFRIHGCICKRSVAVMSLSVQIWSNGPLLEVIQVRNRRILADHWFRSDLRDRDDWSRISCATSRTTRAGIQQLQGLSNDT